MPQSQLPAFQSHSRTAQPFQIAQGETTGAPTAHTTAPAGGESTEEPNPGAVPPATLLFWNSLLVVAIMVLFALAARRKLADIPRGFQNFAEWIVETLNAFTVGVIGEGGERYTPLVGTVFVYILLMNLLGAIPGFHSPTSNLTITLALGVVVFVYVQYEGIRNNGLIGYVKHFVGPMPAMAPLIMPVELISECIKPFTLAIRLFGNIFGEDVIIIILAGLGAGNLLAMWIPLQFPVLLLSLLTDVVQAMVFAILTCIYLSLMAHHGPEEHGEEGAIDTAHAH